LKTMVLKCRDCGKRITPGSKYGRCLPCHNARVRASFEPAAVPIYEPRDDELEMIQDGLIRQRKEKLLSPNRCETDEPAEELAIRARLGLT
jgi:hypothetical protein